MAAFTLRWSAVLLVTALAVLMVGLLGVEVAVLPFPGMAGRALALLTFVVTCLAASLRLVKIVIEGDISLLRFESNLGRFTIRAGIAHACKHKHSENRNYGHRKKYIQSSHLSLLLKEHKYPTQYGSQSFKHTLERW